MLAVLLLNRMTMKRVIRKHKISLPSLIKVESVEGSENSLALCCRTCLSTNDLRPIFTSKEVEKRKSHELSLVTGLMIRRDDGLSQYICKNCRRLLKTALQFRRNSRKAEKVLLQTSETKTSKSKYKLRKRQETNSYADIDYDDEEKYKPELPNDDFQNDCSPDDEGFQNESFDDIKDHVTSVTEEVEYNLEENKKPTVKKKRSTLPNASSYKCPICHKEFRMKATYKAHIRFHTNYCVCETCGKRCRNNNQLQEHKRARHGLGRIHKCAYCEYSSATKEALTIHERRHTGERPYICDHCGATFHRRSNLVQHIAIHLPEKNFQCDLCPKRLKSRKFLQIHKHNAHTGRRYGYLCPVCEHRFEKPNKVRAHTRRVHGLQDGDHPPIVRVQLS